MKNETNINKLRTLEGFLLNMINPSHYLKDKKEGESDFKIKTLETAEESIISLTMNDRTQTFILRHITSNFVNK